MLKKSILLKNKHKYDTKMSIFEIKIAVKTTTNCKNMNYELRYKSINI